MIDVRYSLATTDGCVSVGWIGLGKHEWLCEAEPDGRTVGATFSLVKDGEEVSTYEVIGDDWRDIEQNGTLMDILKWVKGGVPLEDAVNAAADADDPYGWNDASEQLEAAKERIARLEALLRRVFLHGNPEKLHRDIQKSLEEGL